MQINASPIPRQLNAAIPFPLSHWPLSRPILVLLLCLVHTHIAASDLQAGVARRNITPTLPVWLSGYAARTNPATGINQTLWAKALALQDPTGTRAVIVTTDLIGLPHEISSAAAREVEQKKQLARANILFNSSHTHAGPVIWPNLKVMFDLSPDELTAASNYAEALAQTLAEVAIEALNGVRPAQLRYGLAHANFAINRRQAAQAGVAIGTNPSGPVDHDVPVLRVESTDGALQAVLFGYACHNTTLVGNNYQIDGDYAGAAQAQLELEHPGLTALFLMLCGGDQNPHPRGTRELAQQHGQSLAAAVASTFQRSLPLVDLSLKSSYREIKLAFAPHSRETFATEERSDHIFRRRRAKLMLEAYDQGTPVRDVRFPIQAIRFSPDLALLGLGGEVVVDYGLTLRKTYGPGRLIVAGYCNDVMCYIPNVRILREGGYEADDSMIYYGQPGPLSEAVEDSVLSAAHSALADVGFVPTETSKQP